MGQVKYKIFEHPDLPRPGDIITSNDNSWCDAIISITHHPENPTYTFTIVSRLFTGISHGGSVLLNACNELTSTSLRATPSTINNLYVVAQPMQGTTQQQEDTNEEEEHKEAN